MWVVPTDTDVTELEAKMIEYGFNLMDYEEAEWHRSTGKSSTTDETDEDDLKTKLASALSMIDELRVV